MTSDSNNSDYSRYFSPRQKVCLVKVSEGHESPIYESLSGVVAKSDINILDLLITNSIHGTHDNEVEKVTYKLTSESLGGGIQVLADLISIEADNIYKFRTYGTLEMFQRRSVPRVDLSAPIYHLRGKYSINSFRKEWQRAMDRLHNNDGIPGLDLNMTEINLSVGGIGITVDALHRSTPLSMFFIELDKGLPVCALAETVWEKRVEERFSCGFRFIHILKTDQERINNFISDLIRKNGGTYLDYKRSWELVEKMVAEVRKPV